jgi:DNA replication protein DnaC
MGASSEVAHLARALKAPRIADAAATLAKRAREDSWDYEHNLARVLEEEVLARETSGGRLRVKAARLPAVKTLDDFDFGFQRSVHKHEGAAGTAARSTYTGRIRAGVATPRSG